MTTLEAATATDLGRIRETNQDVALIADGLIAVADGMGGHAGGEIAAATAVEALRNSFFAEPTIDGLVHAAQQANTVVYERGVSEEGLHGMGTTLTAAALISANGSDVVGIINVGDSRAYLLDDGSFTQLTRDHSLVEEMVRQGEITTEQAATHPHRHILTRALGIDDGVEVDVWQIEPHAGMRVLLCSDGLTNECTDEEIAAVLRDVVDVQHAAQALVDRAMGHGGNDNITVVVADVTTATGSAASQTTEAVDQKPATQRSLRPTKASAVSTPSPTSTAPRARSTAPKMPPPLRVKSDPLITPRVVFFVIALILVIGGAFGFILWFNNATYFVGISGNQVAIYNGRPGGLLWMKPTLVQTTPLSVNSVFESNLPMLKSGILESSYSNAETVVQNLSNEGSALGFPATTTTTTSTSTTTTSTTTPSPVTTVVKH